MVRTHLLGSGRLKIGNLAAETRDYWWGIHRMRERRSFAQDLYLCDAFTELELLVTYQERAFLIPETIERKMRRETSSLSAFGIPNSVCAGFDSGEVDTNMTNRALLPILGLRVVRLLFEDGLGR